MRGWLTTAAWEAVAVTRTALLTTTLTFPAKRSVTPPVQLTARQNGLPGCRPRSTTNWYERWEALDEGDARQPQATPGDDGANPPSIAPRCRAATPHRPRKRR